MSYDLYSRKHTVLADTITPVGIYLRARSSFGDSILLETSDYHGKSDAYSYICTSPLAEIKIKDGQIDYQWPNGEESSEELTNSFSSTLNAFRGQFNFLEKETVLKSQSLFGYLGFEAIQYFETITLRNKESDFQIPDIFYRLFGLIYVFDHSRNKVHVCSHGISEESCRVLLKRGVDLFYEPVPEKQDFKASETENSNLTDEGFIASVKKCIEHCNRGDVFQIVPSRRFTIDYSGDDFTLYRALRTVNPSPYLFYFDFGDFRIFGSSPESQLLVKNRKATIHPIAGTIKRSGDDRSDLVAAETLKADPKENAEHVMLVDLARNDLSRNGKKVEVEVYREIQFFSHVVHLVSQVSGELHPTSVVLDVVADTFPAGTLSGAPKFRAMEILDELENRKRGFYGGAIGYYSFDDEFVHAIMIRTLLSQDKTLYLQAGAGVVAKSIPENELNEVTNKLGALRKAIQEANHLNTPF